MYKNPIDITSQSLDNNNNDTNTIKLYEWNAEMCGNTQKKTDSCPNKLMKSLTMIKWFCYKLQGIDLISLYIFFSSQLVFFIYFWFHVNHWWSCWLSLGATLTLLIWYGSQWLWVVEFHIIIIFGIKWHLQSQAIHKNGWKMKTKRNEIEQMFRVMWFRAS